MFIWTFFITKTQEITSCNYALKSWNTLYIGDWFFMCIHLFMFTRCFKILVIVYTTICPLCIQGFSRLVNITAGGHFLGFVIKKVYINICPILGGYGDMGTFWFPYTPSCETHLTEPAGGWCTQLGGLSFAEATTIKSRSSQPGGNLCCGRRWHFRKPTLSTDQFKLKKISWS